MKKNTDKEEKICWKCKRTLVEESKLGLCPDCVNKYSWIGVTGATGVIGIALIRKIIFKYIGKAVIGVANLIRQIIKV